MNGVNIDHFQFEYDLTWMSFFQNEKGQTYLRYGGREDVGPESHLNKDSLLLAMKQTLVLHKQAEPRVFNRFEPSPDSKRTPEDIPSTQKLLANRQNKCIHCHDVKGALLRDLQANNKLEKSMVFSYPSPSNLGISLDAVHQNKIKNIIPASSAKSAGLKSGDVLKSLAEQPVFTFADVTRVLELAPNKGTLEGVASRGDEAITFKLDLANGWKAIGDPSWRESTHIVGPNSGFWGVALSSAQQKSLNIDGDRLAIRATAIWGQWAKKAGVKHGDIVTSIDGQSEKMSIKQLQTYLQMNKEWGETVKLTVLRKRRPVELTMILPNETDD